MDSRERRVQRLFGLLVTWAVVGATIGISWDLAANRMQVLVVLSLVGTATSLLVWCVRRQDWRALGLDLSTELIGAVVIYLLLELAVGGAEEKARLISEMRSQVNDVALVATEELRQNGWLTDGTLQRAYLVGANLQNADLWSANLQEADLWAADLQGASLWQANLQRALLVRADLRGSDLQSADLREIRMSGAYLQKAFLVHANLQGADLQLSDFQGADFRGTDLRGANFQGANLRDARFDDNTILPDGTQWTPDTDMARFTDPDHPEFWRSDNSSSPAYRAKDGD